VPLFIFYSMFGFQRVGDLIWAAADARARGFLVGATAGRTTLVGEGLQHADGHSHLLASVVPSCRAWDPSFAYEMAAIVERGLHTMYGPGSDPSHDDTDDNDEFTYMTVYNEPWVMPAQPEGVTADDIMAGMYKFANAPDGLPTAASVLFSGPSHGAATAAREALAGRGIGVELWSVPGWKQLREQGLDTVRWNRLHPDDKPRIPLVTTLLAGDGPVVAVTDYMTAIPDQISRFVPASRPFVSLGTDGYGRSDDRAEMRRFFEVDAASVEVAVLDALAAAGTVEPSVVAAAIADHGLDTSADSPRVR